MHNNSINRDKVNNSINSVNSINSSITSVSSINKNNIVEIDFLERQRNFKKPYVKPIVLIQGMNVNSFCAGTCSDKDAIVLNYGENNCKLYDEESGITYFGEQCFNPELYGEFGINIINPNPQSPYAQLCYHRPLDSLSFFSS